MSDYFSLRGEHAQWASRAEKYRRAIIYMWEFSSWERERNTEKTHEFHVREEEEIEYLYASIIYSREYILQLLLFIWFIAGESLIPDMRRQRDRSPQSPTYILPIRREREERLYEPWRKREEKDEKIKHKPYLFCSSATQSMIHMLICYEVYIYRALRGWAGTRLYTVLFAHTGLMPPLQVPGSMHRLRYEEEY